MIPAPRTAAPEARSSDPIDWARALDDVFAGRSPMRLVFQPIVDMRRGVTAGFEALTRFSGPPAASPDRWFAAADALGCGPELERRVLELALAARPTLPANTFLSVNVSPHLVAQPVLRDHLLAQRDLSRVVLEMTEHVAVSDYSEVLSLLDRLRARGASVAIDDAGSGYSGLQQIAALRPQFVKLDRALVDQVDRDEIKLALAELLGSFAGRIDAWLIAEGIERPEEVAALARLGVPLGQGWFFARPGDAWPGLVPGSTDRLAAPPPAPGSACIGDLAEPRPAFTEDDEPDQVFTTLPGLDCALVVDDRGRPMALLRPDGRTGAAVRKVPLRVHRDATVEEIALRSLTRDDVDRFDPVVCVTASGVLAGVVPMERVLSHLARRGGPAAG